MYKIPAITLFLGKNLIFVPECHSTNDLALLLCQKSSLLEGSLVITRHQTAGRGQRGNTWLAEPGKNLTFSFIVKPGFLEIKQQFYLNVFVSLGIRDYLTEHGIKKVQIKWPNDVLVDQKKISGILIENQITGSRLNSSVIGVGLNINQQRFETGTPTSLSIVTQQEHDLSSALEQLLQKLERRYFQLKEQKFEALLHDYLDCLYLLNKPHVFYSDGNPFEGTITGLDDVGRLQVNIGGQVKVFDIKQIQYR